MLDARLATLALAALASACGDRPAPTPTPAPASVPAATEPAAWSEAWLAREGERFGTDAGYRRAALEASLTNPENIYSRYRLGAYARGTAGWDLLPVWNPRTRPITAELAAVLERGEQPDAPRAPLWDGAEPTTPDAWIALGRRVFFEYPLRAEVFMEWGLQKPALAASIGVERTAAGDLPGLVVFGDVDGASRVGITCAICHSAVQDGETVTGAARRRFDYGRLRVAYFAATREPVDPDQVRRMASWGPGRADVTEDEDEDPVTIPDLWGLRAQSWLTQAGTIRHASPLALAIRQDTQLIDSNHQRVRPPRVLVWALTRFLYSLEPPPAVASSRPDLVPRGATLFAQQCASCHANAAYGGRLIDAATIGTEPALAAGLGRGTGRYRVPPLVRIRDGAPYLHDGSVNSLDELLSPARLAPDYRAGRLGRGPIPGHRAGTELVAADRAALVAFLETL